LSTIALDLSMFNLLRAITYCMHVLVWLLWMNGQYVRLKRVSVAKAQLSYRSPPLEPAPQSF